MAQKIMTLSDLNPITKLQRHYPSQAARMADLVVHIIGLTLAVIGGGVLLGFAIATGKIGLITAVSIYAIGFIAMLAFSTHYNFAPPEKRAARNKYDHAGIFLMIGASYTPFTTQALSGVWAWSMTLLVWSVVAICVVAKLMDVKLSRKIWIAIYIALGWIALIAAWPLMQSVHWVALLLLLIGGIVYSVGVIFHVKRTIPFSKAIWHGHVVTAASVHWVAIFLGVVLIPGYLS